MLGSAVQLMYHVHVLSAHIALVSDHQFIAAVELILQCIFHLSKIQWQLV
jgi:hypothetical protein